LIASNPPYLAEDDPHLGRGDLRFEPRRALAAGADGLADLRRIVDQAAAHLEADGWLLLEHGHDQGEAVPALLAAAGYRAVACVPDLGGRPRVSLAQAPA
ncbi:MAG TPA: protein-(glutamine-N5) methyltransferase, release factor-specific, partial [Plasticicumulans sp.]|nr:protein-(glutamine-N5) methyltransferase, release factor-specific [Plasticicumulans sp.]